MFEDFFILLDNLLEDEKKIVTLKSFAVQNELQIGNAMEVLSQYVQKSKDTNKKLSVTFCLCGYIITENNTKLFQVELVSDTNLKDSLSKYLPTCTYHVFSLQPNSLPSLTLLHNANLDINKECSFSSISQIHLSTVATRKEPLCMINIQAEALQKLTIKSNNVVPTAKEAKHDNLEKDNVEKVQTINPKASGNKTNHMESFFGKKIAENSSKLTKNKVEINEMKDLDDSKIEKTSNGSEKSLIFNKKVTNNSKSISKLLASKTSQLASTISNISQRKRKCNISSSDEDSSDDQDEVEQNNSPDFCSVIPPESDTILSEKAIDSNLKESCDTNNIISSLDDNEDKNCDRAVSQVVDHTGKKTLMTKRYIGEDGFMITEKVWECAKMNIDQDLLNDNNNSEAKKENFPVKSVPIVDHSEKVVLPNKICTKPRSKIQPNKQSTLTNFFNKK